MTEGLLTKVTAGLKQFVASNPSVLTAKSLINQKGGRIASKTQQSDSLWLAVNPPPFDKGGKCGGAVRGVVVLLQWLWEWKGSVQREGQARQGCLSVCALSFARMQNHTSTHRPSPYEKREG